MRHEGESREQYLGRGEWFTGRSLPHVMRESFLRTSLLVGARRRADPDDT